MSNAQTSINTKLLKPKAANFFKIVNKLFDILSILVMITVVITVLIQIIGRLIGSPAPWTEEGTRFLFIWMIFLGVGIGFRRGESARVTVFLKWMPRFIQKASKWIYSVATVAFFLFMLINGIQLVGQQFNMHEMGSALMIPMWLIGICIPVSAVLGILGVIENLLLYPELLEGDE